MSLDDNDDNNSIFLKTLSKRFDFNNDFESCDNKTCEARQLWAQVKNLLQDREVDKKKKKDLSFYKDMEYAYQNIKDILLSFSSYKSIIEKLPKNIKDSFSMSNLYKSIKKTQRI